MDLDSIVAAAIAEDMPAGDLTVQSLQLTEIFGRARVVAKEDLVLSGTEAFNRVFAKVDPNIRLDWVFKDGDFVYAKQTVCTLTGDLTKIVSAERSALNFLGRLSGIASLTRCYAEKCRGTRTKILDTRKTTPLLRDLEKQAVVHGGGENHRRDLSSAVMLKENHIMFAGGISEAIRRVRRSAPDARLIVEVTNLEELKAAIAERPDRVLLDNMDDETIQRAVELIPSFIESEVSGNMTLDRIASVAAIGVDFISIGALTHSAPCADLSLIVEDKT